MHQASPARTSRWQLAWLGAIIVLAFVLVLAWNFPARWAMPWVEPYLHGMQLQQVHGSLWNGQADRVVLPDGRELGHASWKVSRRVLYAAVPVQVHLDGPPLAFSADVRMLPHGQTRWDHVQLRTDLGRWPGGAWMGVGQPGGEWQMTADHVLLQDGWPLQLDVHASWHDATLRTPRGLVPLGDLAWVASASEGVIAAQVHDVGAGPLHVTGQLLLSPLGWRLSAQLRPRQANPALQGWLATLGSTDAAGVVHVQRRGGVALPVPAS